MRVLSSEGDQAPEEGRVDVGGRTGGGIFEGERLEVREVVVRLA